MRDDEGGQGAGPRRPAKASASVPLRGDRVGSGRQAVDPDAPAAVDEPVVAPEGATELDVVGQEVDEVGGTQCPVDPMERLQCESCQ